MARRSRPIHPGRNWRRSNLECARGTSSACLAPGAGAIGSPPPNREVGADLAQLDVVIAVAIRAGRQAERARIGEILKLPGADRFPRLAASIALAESVAVEQAIEYLAVAESDVLARWQSTESPFPESTARVLH